MSGILELVAVTKSYGQRRGIVDVGLEVDEGEVFGFLGPNGAGKTTTIRLILGLIRPSAGSVRVFGLDAWSEAPEAHRRLAHLGSAPGYLPELTARQQLEYLAALRGLGRDAWRRLAERLELDASVPIRKLSHGNRQKVGVVAAFMGQEPLIVLDEPTNGLDPLMQREFLTMVAEARRAGRTVFMSSHNLPEVERSCDRIGIIRDGRLAEITTVEALLASHWRSINLVLDASPPEGHFEMPDVEVVSSAARDVHLLVRGDIDPVLDRIAALHVRDISISTPDIEDLFLRFYQAPGHEPVPAGTPGAIGDGREGSGR